MGGEFGLPRDGQAVAHIDLPFDKVKKYTDRMLSIVDEFTRECLTIEVARKFKGADVVKILEEVLRFDDRTVSRIFREIRRNTPTVIAVEKCFSTCGWGYLIPDRRLT